MALRGRALRENAAVASFVYAKIPLDPGWAERLPGVYEAVEQALASRAAGALIGWGRSMSAPGGRGVDAVTHQRLDIEVNDQDLALALLKQALAGLGAPPGTELHYTEDGRDLQAVYAGAAWAAPTASTATSRRAHRRRP